VSRRPHSSIRLSSRRRRDPSKNAGATACSEVVGGAIPAREHKRGVNWAEVKRCLPATSKARSKQSAPKPTSRLTVTVIHRTVPHRRLKPRGRARIGQATQRHQQMRCQVRAAREHHCPAPDAWACECRQLPSGTGSKRAASDGVAL
jgi:hypothetical protein